MTDQEQKSNNLAQVEATASVEKNSHSEPPTMLPEAMQLMGQITHMRASLGPDPETAKIIAETERHSEDNRLEGYKAGLEQRDRQAQRDHIYRLKQLAHNSIERYIILFVCIVGLIAGAYITLKGQPSLGNPIMSAALTVLLTLLTGRLKIG